MRAVSRMMMSSGGLLQRRMVTVTAAEQQQRSRPGGGFRGDSRGGRGGGGRGGGGRGGGSGGGAYGEKRWGENKGDGRRNWGENKGGGRRWSDDRREAKDAASSASRVFFDSPRPDKEEPRVSNDFFSGDEDWDTPSFAEKSSGGGGSYKKDDGGYKKDDGGYKGSSEKNYDRRGGDGWVDRRGGSRGGGRGGGRGGFERRAPREGGSNYRNNNINSRDDYSNTSSGSEYRQPRSFNNSGSSYERRAPREGTYRRGSSSSNNSSSNSSSSYRRNDDFNAEREDGDDNDSSDNRQPSRYSGNSGSGSGLPTLRDSWIGDVVYGVAPVLAALEAGRRTVHTLYIHEGADSSKRKDKSALAAATARAKELGAAVVSAPKHDLNMVSDNRPHQGLVLDASELDFETMDAMPAASSVWDADARAEGVPPPVWLCLDEVVDPQNFGAALRSAFFLGAAGVLTCRRNSAPLSAVVSKASAGAMELVPVHSCRSLPSFLADAKQRGWTVVGAAAQADAVPASRYTPQTPTILVMGNEGYGVRTTVRQQCDAMLRIDGGGRGMGATGLGIGKEAVQSMVDSLNVSVATGILLHQLLAPRGGAEAADK